MAFDIAPLGMSIDARPVGEGVKQLDNLVAAAGRAEKSTLGFTASTRSMGVASTGAASSLREMAQAVSRVEAEERQAAGAANRLSAANAEVAASAAKASAQARVAAASFVDFYEAANRDFATQYVGSMEKVVGVQGRAHASSKHLTQATLNLSRQFADVGVTAAMGMNPLMILIQQGPQIADAFQMAKTQGLGFNAVLAGMWAQLAPIVAILAPIGIAVGVVAGAFAIGAQQINSENGKISDGLGLTAKQLKKVKDDSVTFGDTAKATFQVAGAAIYKALDLGPLASRIRSFYQAFVDGSVVAVKAVVGGFMGAFGVIKATWGMFPAVMGDAVVSAVNVTLSGVAKMVNFTVDLLNGLINKANAVAAAVGLSTKLGTFSHVEAAQLSNPNSGAMQRAGETAAKAFSDGLAKGGKLVDATLGAITAQALKNAEARVRKEAGDAAKTGVRKAAADPRDVTDERTAQIAGLLAQAQAEELQARLGLTREVKARADIEKQIAAAQQLARQAEIDRQIANIEDDKGLSAAKKRELSAQLELVKTTISRVGSLRDQAIDEAASAALAKEALARKLSEQEVAIDVLASQSGVARSASARRAIELRILAHQQQIERIKLEEIVVSAQSTKTERDIAQARLDVLAKIHGEQRGAAYRLEDAYNDAADAVSTVARSIKDRDWFGVVKGLISAFDALKLAFSQAGTMAGKIGAVAGIANVVGQAVGGKAGGALSGAASGAMAGTMILPGIGTAIGAVIGGVAGFLGAGNAKKQAEREAADRAIAAERQRQLQIEQQRMQLEIALMQASGDAAGALAAQRRAELNAMDASLRGLQEELYAKMDAAEATQKLADAQATYNAGFLSDSEQLVVSQKKINDELAKFGLAGVTTKAAFRSVVESLDQSTDAGRSLYKMLLDLAPAFLEVANAAEQAAQTAVDNARSDLAAAREREARDMQATIDKLDALSDTLRKVRDDVSGALISAADNDYMTAKAAFGRTSLTAGLGDTKAAADLPGVIQTFVASSKASQTTAVGYARDLAAARRAADATLTVTKTAADVARDQLATMNAQVDALLGINVSVMSVRDAIGALAAAMSSQAAAIAASQAAATVATPSAPTSTATSQPAVSGPNWASYLANHPDVAAEYEAESTRDAKSKAYLALLGITNAEQFAHWHYDTAGKAAGWNNFATGGSFEVMGSGGPDSQNFGSFNLSPGEIGNITRKDVMASLLDEIRSLNEEVGRLRNDVRPMVRDMGKVESLLQTTTQGGRAMQTEPAS